MIFIKVFLNFCYFFSSFVLQSTNRCSLQTIFQRMDNWAFETVFKGETRPWIILHLLHPSKMHSFCVHCFLFQVFFVFSFLGFHFLSYHNHTIFHRLPSQYLNKCGTYDLFVLEFMLLHGTCLYLSCHLFSLQINNRMTFGSYHGNSCLNNFCCCSKDAYSLFFLLLFQFKCFSSSFSYIFDQIVCLLNDIFTLDSIVNDPFDCK